MSTLLLTPSGDLDITNGRTTVVTDPVQAGAIKLKNRFSFFIGTWFRDTRQGIPWWQLILVKKYSIPVIQNIFRQVIMSTPPFVNAVVVVTPPDGARRANCSFVATVDPLVAAGATVTATALEAPFIINTTAAGAS